MLEPLEQQMALPLTTAQGEASHVAFHMQGRQRQRLHVPLPLTMQGGGALAVLPCLDLRELRRRSRIHAIEFIPIRPSLAMGSTAHESYAARSRLP
jgi:hypothetical protein